MVRKSSSRARTAACKILRSCNISDRAGQIWGLLANCWHANYACLNSRFCLDPNREVLNTILIIKKKAAVSYCIHPHLLFLCHIPPCISPSSSPSLLLWQCLCLSAHATFIAIQLKIAALARHVSQFTSPAVWVWAVCIQYLLETHRCGRNNL